LFQHPGFQDIVGIDPLDQIEEEQKRELFGIGDRIGITAA
jgi:hypothetical protein